MVGWQIRIKKKQKDQQDFEENDEKEKLIKIKKQSKILGPRYLKLHDRWRLFNYQ